MLNDAVEVINIVKGRRDGKTGTAYALTVGVRRAPPFSNQTRSAEHVFFVFGMASPDDSLTVVVRDALGELHSHTQVTLKLRFTTKMKQVMDAYSVHVRQQRDQVRFEFRGNTVMDDDTAETLRMVDGAPLFAYKVNRSGVAPPTRASMRAGPIFSASAPTFTPQSVPVAGACSTASAAPTPSIITVAPAPAPTSVASAPLPSPSDHAALSAALTCAVCFDFLSIPATLPCGHSFCRETCLAPWLAESRCCPCCREPAPSLPLKNIALAVAVRVHRGQTEAEADAESARGAAAAAAAAAATTAHSTTARPLSPTMAAPRAGLRTGLDDLDRVLQDLGQRLEANYFRAAHARPFFHDTASSEAGDEESSSGYSESDDEDAVAAFQTDVLTRLTASGGAIRVSVLGSAVPRAQRPRPEASLIDQLSEYVPGLVIEHGARREGRVALESDAVAVFGIRVRSALRAAGGVLSGSELGSRVRQRLPGGDRLWAQVEDNVEDVVITHHEGGWRAELTE